jgi:hypothetical protein
LSTKKPHFSVEGNRRADRQLSLTPTLIEKRHRDLCGAIRHRGLNHGSALPGAGCSNGRHVPDNGDFVAFLGAGDRLLFTAIHPAPRVVGDQIKDVGNSYLVEAVQHCRAHSAQAGQRDIRNAPQRTRFNRLGLLRRLGMPS